MAALEIVHLNGIASYQGTQVDIFDGPPVASKTIDPATSSPTMYGSANSPAIVKLTPIGGDVTLTWPGGLTETIRGVEARRVRGEAVSVA